MYANIHYLVHPVFAYSLKMTSSCNRDFGKNDLDNRVEPVMLRQNRTKNHVWWLLEVTYKQINYECIEKGRLLIERE